MHLAEVDLFFEGFKSLMAAGPVAGVLGFVCWKLWNKLSDLEASCKQERSDKDKEFKDLRSEKDKEIKELHGKTLKIAVRVQRSVEALAKMEQDPEVEEDFDDYEKK